MNPSPHLLRPFNPPPRLIDTHLSPPGYVPATLTRGFPVERLDVIETVWAPERGRLASELRAHGETLESRRWDWRSKSGMPPYWHTLVTVECGGQVQGVMAVENLLRPSRLSPSEWVLYLDYVEVAPWNTRVPLDRSRAVVREPRYRGVGALLLGEAIRMSIGVTAGGRVGLYSLPQAENFYVHCGMVRSSPDPDPSYYGLVYFEYPDGVAGAQLTAMGLSI